MIGQTWAVLALCLAATLAVGLVRYKVPVVASMAIGLSLRVGFAAMTSERFTPRDVRVYFASTGRAVLSGQDPLAVLPGRQWNFLELMPYVHALELQSGLHWVYAVKIVPIACDVALVWMVARLAPHDGRTRALQYALNPLSLLIVSLHGQVEPVALALALGGLLLLRRNRPLGAGVLLGAAVAAKTWPVFILLAVLPGRDRRSLVRLLAGSALVPLACLTSGVLLLDASVAHDLSRLTSYSGFVQEWTWSGLLIEIGAVHTVGYDSPVGAWGSKALLVGAAVALYLVRRRSAEYRALCVLSACLVCTAGFGTQYLLWPLPLIMAMSGRVRLLYLLCATSWAALFYLSPFTHPADVTPYLRALSWLPAAVLLAVVREQVPLPGRHVRSGVRPGPAATSARCLTSIATVPAPTSSRACSTPEPDRQSSPGA